MVPDVGKILKNKVDSNFFWFWNRCFSKFWNICRPIFCTPVRYLSSLTQKRPKRTVLWIQIKIKSNFCLYFDIKIILRFVPIVKWFLFGDYFVQIDQLHANRHLKTDNDESIWTDMAHIIWVAESTGRNRACYLDQTMLPNYRYSWSNKVSTAIEISFWRYPVEK